MKLINDPTKHVIKEEWKEKQEEQDLIDYSEYTKLTENLEEDWGVKDES